MPRRKGHRGRSEDSDSSSSSDQNGSRSKSKQNDNVEVSLDMRNIPEKIEEEMEYFEKNKNRKANGAGDALYFDESSGTKIGKWGGNKKRGKSANIGIVSAETEAGIYEQNLGVGELSVGYVDEDDQKGIEGEVSAWQCNQRIGPVRVNTSALGVGYEAGVGRNTGGFVRGNIASVGGQVGPVGATAGIGFDTGGRVGADGVEARVLGTGLMVDRNEGVEVSLFGTSIKFKPW